MRARLTLALVSAAVAAVAAGCSTSTSNGGTVSVVITPGGPIQAVPGGASTGFTAKTYNTSNSVTWTMSPASGAAGTISPTTGPSVVYTPPPSGGVATTVTLTASVTGVTATGTVTINLAPSVVTAETIPSLSAPVSVTYDSRDIPNITCQKQTDCFTVQGYLHAHDRLFEMDFLRREAEGKLSELLGVAALGQDTQLRTLFTTPFSNPPGQAIGDALWATLAADPTASNEVAILQAYANGVNAYISAMKAGDPSAPFPAEYGLLLPFKLGPSVVEAWLPQDSVAIARLFQFQLSDSTSEEVDNTEFLQTYAQGPLADLAKVNAWLRCQQPVPNAYTITAAVAGGGPVPAAKASAPSSNLSILPLGGGLKGLRALSAQMKALQNSFGFAAERAGSNNWVVKGSASSSGAAMVANDPHLPLQYPPLFHLASLTGDGLQVVGAAFPGIPAVEIGRSGHLGWGVTVVGYDVTDLYVETIDPSNGKIIFGGASGTLSIIQVQQNVTVRIANVGTTPDTTTHQITISLSPVHGSFIQQLSATQFLSRRWTGLEVNRCGANSNQTCNPFKAFFGLLTAANVDAAIASLASYDTGAQNFVLADDSGNIAYDPHAFVPERAWAGNVVNLGAAGTFTLLPWAALPGVGVAEWGVPGGPPSWVPDAQLPQGKNPAKGYFATANAAPWAQFCTTDPTIPAPASLGMSATAPPTVPYLSFAWDDATAFRAGRIDSLLASYTDGGTVSLADMQAIQTDHVATIAASFLPLLPMPTSTTGSYASAMTLMNAWKADGLNCPTGLIGTDPVSGVPDTSGTNAQDSAGCLLFHAFLNRFLVDVFAAPLAAAGQGIDGVKAIKAALFMLSPNLPAPYQSFCAANNCAAQAQKDMAAAFDQVTQTFGAQSNWIWGRVHTVTPASYGSVAGISSSLYNPGPYARPGGAFTVDVGNPGLRNDNLLSYPYGSGSNVRWIAALDGSATKEQLPGPIVDGPFYPGSPGLLGQYVQNEYFDFPYGPAAITAATVRTQTFSP